MTGDTWIDGILIVVVLFSAFANLFLALYVYRKNPKEKINTNFFYLGFSIFVWCISMIWSLIDKTVLGQKIAFSTALFMPPTAFLFSCALTNKKISGWAKGLLMAFAVGIGLINLFAPFFIKGIELSPGGCEPDVGSSLGCEVILGSYFYVWMAYIITVFLACVYVLISGLKKADEIKKRQISYFLIGITLFSLWAIIVSVIMPVLGYNQLNDFDTPATLFVVGFTSYSIIKYKLMNVKTLFFQAFVYALVIVLIVVSLLLLMFIGMYFLEHLYLWAIYILATLVAVALFFIGRLFYIEKRGLEQAKINLAELLEKSENNRKAVEIERDRTDMIVKSLRDGLILLDEKDKIFSVNPEAEKILKINADQLLNKLPKNLSDIIEFEPIASILGEGFDNVFRKEVNLGKDCVIELSVIQLNLKQKDVGHLIVIHDISREKIIDKMKTEFVSLAAHQLRTPLSIVKWSMSMLKNGDMGKLTKKQDEVVCNTYKNNERLISIVNDLLNVTRIEEGRYVYNSAPADLRKIVDGVIDIYKVQIKEKKIKLSFIKPDNMPDVSVDAEKIKLVVQNFLDNAIKYSPKGGNIIITLDEDGKEAKLRVQDFGIGINENQKEKIFTKFFRGDNAIKINTTGSGLGLFLAKNIIEAHGGKMWFESEENIGTSFYFALPIKKN